MLRMEQRKREQQLEQPHQGRPTSSDADRAANSNDAASRMRGGSFLAVDWAAPTSSAKLTSGTALPLGSPRPLEPSGEK